MKSREFVLMGLLSCVLVISGIFKIPSFVLGGEFQLSAPIAVVMACIFGFKRYLISGIVASIIGFFLGTATIFNILIAMVFRIIVGVLIELFGVNLFTLFLAGATGSLIARYVLSLVLNVPLWPLLVASFPGMIGTGIVAYVLYPILLRLLKATPFEKYIIMPKTSFWRFKKRGFI